jgi:hypothetical protein
VAGPIQWAPAREVVAGQIAADVVDGDPQTAGEQVGTEAGGGNVGGQPGPTLCGLPQRPGRVIRTAPSGTTGW